MSFKAKRGGCLRGVVENQNLLLQKVTSIWWNMRDIINFELMPPTEPNNYGGGVLSAVGRTTLCAGKL